MNQTTMPRVLFAFNRDLNPYVDVVMDGTRKAGIPLTSGTDFFWNASAFDFDLVHIQWPETLFDWRVPTSVEMEFLKRRLIEIRRTAKIVYTRHNKESHHINAQNADILRALYSMIESAADVMVHLGEASRLESEAQWMGALAKMHVVIPIPVYDDLYGPFASTTSENARVSLGFPSKANLALAFGNFRYPSERQLVLSAMSSLKKDNVWMDVPKWYKPHEFSWNWQHPCLFLRTARKWISAHRDHLLPDNRKVMEDSDVATHFAAADVVFLQRIDELNSGNLPMGFFFKKVVVGPDCGNIGYWLKKTGNPVFQVNSPESVTVALKQGMELARAGKGEENYHFAMNHWRSEMIGALHAELYRTVLANKKFEDVSAER